MQKKKKFPFEGSLSFPYFYDNLMQNYTIQNLYALRNLIDKKILWGLGWSSRYSWGANSRFMESEQNFCLKRIKNKLY